MERLPDWEERLAAYLASVRDLPFRWGRHDCALHGAAAVAAVTGEDHGAPFRGRYSTARGSVRALRKFGAGTIEATFDAVLPERPVAFARRGDLVLRGFGREAAIGVCVGGDALFVGELDDAPGLVRVSRAEWSKCWSVG